MNKKITNLLFVISIAVFLFGSGYKIGQYKANKTSYNIVNSDKKADQSRNIDFDLFWETWEKVEQKYIDQKKVDAKKMFYGAIKGMVASMDDPYTFFLTPEENKQTKDDLQGKFEGIGAQLGLKENRVVVIAPLKGSPSEAAGIKAGDFINKVNGQPTKGWTLPQAVSKIRGDKGTKVTLTLQRNDKEFDTTITRSQIIVESVELKKSKEWFLIYETIQVVFWKAQSI
ncbi:MAG: Carboxyl-terminal protease [Candidatus Roizmanbacteria bacterium GW2011_GWA2_36_23]|uniref:Carboxyl-terminal protease n=1 Tax=Candidatus Roizmanbacteria bacterium GW2011_GWA2_36_23 TaxID=1618480 RepID=A0A0G0HCY7_9BACT|nr:MAG: Carboxyl-terminal protease [Candidatus Roizmanbacteria bacterium GW2011_GWA2_36_23]